MDPIEKTDKEYVLRLDRRMIERVLQDERKNPLITLL